MGDCTEILLTTDQTQNLGSASVWNYKAGTSLHYYKGGGILTSNSVAFIRNDYFIAAEKLKPLIHVWQINSQEISKQLKIVTPGPVNSLDVSPDGNYCIAGINEHLYIWQVSTGTLLGNVAKHFQPIIKVKFSKDGNFVITAGEDGIVIIWRLGQLISNATIQLEPLHTLTDHTLSVRDFCVSSSTKSAYLITVSSDCSLKIHQINSGELLLSVIFNTPLTAVTCNPTGTQLFIGNTNGEIQQISLLNPPRNRTYHDLNSESSEIFMGHTKSITSLSVSIDGLSLASGSADNLVIIWHIPTKQKIKTLNHNGPLTNVSFFMAKKNMFVEEFKPLTILTPFKRDLSSNENQSQIIEVIHSKDMELP